MKTTIKLFLLVTLFCSVSFADDGDMGNGSRTCSQNCPAAAIQGRAEKIITNDDSILDSILEYFDSILGISKTKI